MTVYGFAAQQRHIDNKHTNKQRNLTILNPPVHQIENQQQQELHKFWIGRRLNNDEELLYTTKKSPKTLDRTTHKLDIDIQFEYFITYVGVAVNVSERTGISLIFPHAIITSIYGYVCVCARRSECLQWCAHVNTKAIGYLS